jgi:hypothetical protein
MNLIPLAPNARTHERKRLARQQERERLIRRIGIRLEDAPLYSEELRFLAYMESLGK